MLVAGPARGVRAWFDSTNVFSPDHLEWSAWHHYCRFPTIMHDSQTRAILLTIILVAATAIVPAGVAADSDDSGDPIDDWLTQVNDANNDTEPGIIDRITSFAPPGLVQAAAVLDGQAARFYGNANPFADTPSNAEQAEAFEEAWEANNATFEREINDRTNVSKSYDTHVVIVAHEDGGDAVPVYVLGDVDNGTVSNTRVLSQSEFNETDREVDYLWVVDGDAQENLPQLVNNVASRILSGKSMGKNYQAKLGGRYCSGVTGAVTSGKFSLENCDIRSTMWLSENKTLEGGDA